MREESCKNCAHYPGCLTHSAAIFFYFVATGRDWELPADKSDFNARGFCGSLFKEKDADGGAQRTSVMIAAISRKTAGI